MSRSKVKISGDKKRKSAAFCQESCGIFSEAFLGGAVWWENQHMLSSLEYGFLIWQVITFGIVILC